MTGPRGRPAGGRGGEGGVRGTLARRITLACLLVAVLAVGVAGLVAQRLVAITARETTAEVLARDADLVAALDGATGTRIAAVLGAQDVALVRVGPGG
ncbi:MAG: two-component sensor histidine kinase, partial [Pseudonocardiales bacterium]|nr:two-component sensor histidine kinase [Pseudonocardiales bacterium]